jgi:hypothetical protein
MQHGGNSLPYAHGLLLTGQGQTGQDCGRLFWMLGLKFKPPTATAMTSNV